MNMGCCGQQHDDGRAIAMDDLTVIGVENGALVVVSADGTRFRVPITEALHTALRQNRPAAAAPHRVGPREVQSMIRQGLSATEVAASTSEPLEYIQRFEGPVLAEREYVITAARSVPVAVASESEAGVSGTFGSVIDQRLSELGARSLRWDSRKKDTQWIVSVDFLDDDVARTAVWGFDPKKSTLAPANREAQSLSQQGDVEAPLLPRLRAVPVDDLDSHRFDSGAFTPALSASRHGRPAGQPLERPERPIARMAQDATNSQNVGQTADLLEALRRRRGEREMAPGDSEETSRAAHPSTGSIRIVDIPLTTFDTPDTNETSDVSGPPGDAADEAGSPSKDAATTPPVHGAPGKPTPRRTRSPMPSWDEIVFGAKPDDDPA
jgi:hypothetical protein